MSLACVATALLCTALLVSAISLTGPAGAEAAPLPTSREKSCGWKEIPDQEGLNITFWLRVHGVACRRAGRLARRYELSGRLLPGWHARWANYSQELFLCTTPRKYACTHGRHVRLVFPDAE
jgi:hypothetical protein